MTWGRKKSRVRWKNPGAWERLSSRSVRLEFELVGADLFAFEFAAPPVKP